MITVLEAELTRLPEATGLSSAIERSLTAAQELLVRLSHPSEVERVVAGNSASRSTSDLEKS